MSNQTEIRKLRARLSVISFAALGAVFLIFASVFSAGDRSVALTFAAAMSLVLLFLVVRFFQLKSQLRKAVRTNEQ